jgi:AcrR family transcriptional regulator
MPRSSKQFQELRSIKIELIESVAMRCFAAKGFHDTSISYIAKEAGIALPTARQAPSGRLRKAAQHRVGCPRR